MDNIRLNEGVNGQLLATDEIEGAHHELVKMEFGVQNEAILVSETNPLPVTVSNFTDTQPVSGTVDVNNFPATQPVSNNYLSNQVGAWSYVAGSLTGAGNVAATGRCVGIRVFANGEDSSFNINGGNTIQIRSNSGVDVATKGNLLNPVVNWVGGSIDITLEVLA